MPRGFFPMKNSGVGVTGLVHAKEQLHRFLFPLEFGPDGLGLQ